MMRANIEPILEAIPAARQQDARHYGVHPYFTRRPGNVVRAYIEKYSEEGDTVVDPFGGTGVTAIEAFLLGRRGVQNDLNPFANFIGECVADTTLRSTVSLREAFARVERSCASSLRELGANPAEATGILKQVRLPDNIPLPKNSDAEFFYDLFTPTQLAGLALLKEAIERKSDGIERKLLLLAWSASIAKLNKTFLSAKDRVPSRGGSSVFSIYRYKLAKEHVELPLWETFRGRFANVLAAKEEVWQLRNYREQQSRGARTLDSRADFRAMAHDAATLDDVLGPETADYIFTDPPYGAFISYLDLSIIWNHWLGFPVSEWARERETIVGGDLGHTEQHYKDSLRRSVHASMRILRPDRWLSIVFQHWDTSYFSTILESVTERGGELKAAITQTGDVIWSMHKKKNSERVLAGELILTFYKAAQRAIEQHPSNMDSDIASVLGEVLDSCLGNGTRAFSSEAMFNRLVIELWNRRALDCLSIDRKEFATALKVRGWAYDESTHLWSKVGTPERPVQASLFPG